MCACQDADLHKILRVAIFNIEAFGVASYPLDDYPLARVVSSNSRHGQDLIQRAWTALMHHHEVSGDVRAVPALILDRGVRLLVLREFRDLGQPPSLAWIQQSILRDVHRVQRHGIFFGCTFRPDIMQWLSELLGRPSLHPADYPASPAYRNPSWPTFSWHQENRMWDDDIQTIEWSADIVFIDQASFDAFIARWQDRLTGHGAEI